MHNTSFAGHMGELSQFFSKEHDGFGRRDAVKINYGNKTGIKFTFLYSGKKKHYKMWITETDNAADYWCDQYSRDAYRQTVRDYGAYNIASDKMTVEYECEPRAESSKTNNSDIVDDLSDAIIEHADNHSCAKDTNNVTGEQWRECYLYPKLINSAPVENFFRMVWKKGDVSRNSYFQFVEKSIKVFKEMCELEKDSNLRVGCLKKIEKLNVRLVSIAN